MVDLSRENDTIAAIATPLGPGGIGIVRVSGPSAAPLFCQVFRPTKRLHNIASHRLYHGWAVDPHTGEVVDEVLAVLMRAPRSYTREDILEIQCHSGPAILRRILEIVVQQGARVAEAGEFTKRAFLNGRIDLAQAEAVVELVNARGEIQRRCALNLLGGTLTTHIEPVRRTVLDALAHIEVTLDFPEEAEEIVSGTSLAEALGRQAMMFLNELLSAYDRGRIYRDGAQVVIVGRPNVGKSSLLNRLLQEDRAIVTPVPGTTRDLIAEEVLLEGVPVTLIDTAGIHPTSDLVEQLGIERVRRQIDLAHALLWVVDLSEGIQEEDLQLGRELEKRSPLLVLNKRDLAQGWRERCAQAVEFISRTSLWEKDPPWVAVSAVTGEGLDELCTWIVNKVVGGDPVAPPSIVLTTHQCECVRKAHRCIERATTNLTSHMAPELAAADLREALTDLGHISGVDADEDVLDRIFQQFCIGK